MACKYIIWQAKNQPPIVSKLNTPLHNLQIRRGPSHTYLCLTQFSLKYLEKLEETHAFFLSQTSHRSYLVFFSWHNKVEKCLIYKCTPLISTIYMNISYTNDHGCLVTYVLPAPLFSSDVQGPPIFLDPHEKCLIAPLEAD